MLASTNDPIGAARREREKALRAAREGNRAGRTQSFQTTSKVQQQIDELRELVLRLPQTEGRQVDVEDWEVVPSQEEWTTIATATIPRPEALTRAVVSASAMVTGLSSVSSGVLSFRARLVVNGVASQPMDGMAEGATLTRCTALPSFVHELSGLASNVTVQLQLNPPAQLYDIDTRATLSVTAGFATI